MAVIASPNGSRECAPDDRLREAIQTYHRGRFWIASELTLLAITGRETEAMTTATQTVTHSAACFDSLK